MSGIPKTKGKNMRKLMILIAAGCMFGNYALAESSSVSPKLSSDIEVVMKETSSDNWGATTTLGFGIEMSSTAFGGFNLESKDGSSFSLDEWNMGTALGVGTISIGKQGDIWIGAEGEHTIANMGMDESVIVDMGNAKVAMEFGDFTNDLSDIEAIAGSYTVPVNTASATVAVDYDMDTEKTVLGGRVDLGPAGIAGTYANEKFAYEIDGSHAIGISAYANGDQDDAVQNIGAGYETVLAGLTVGGDLNYHLDSKETTPSITIKLSF
tara:strand:- start:1640 stop:2440 length:801 start_codon:yes stop_codon:yes gene_type:complete